jgi:hypothetical protein
MKIKKTAIILMVIFAIALILRIIAASNVDIGPDELVYSVIPLNIIEAGRLGTVEQSPIYFYLKDISYSLFGGVTPISTRLPSIIFGSLATIVLFFLSYEIFRKKNVAFFTSFLFAVSGYAVTYNYESDMTAYFFALLSILFLIRSFKENREWDLLLSAGFLGLAFLCKVLVILFVPAYVFIWLWYFIKNKSNKKLDIKKISYVVGGIILFLIVLIPIFSYNYLTYQEKGITDYYFSNTLGIGETVHQGMANKPWELSRIKEVMKEKVKELFKLDTILLLMVTTGIYFSWKRRKIETTFLLLTGIFLIGYISGVTGSPTHYLWLPILLSIFGALTLNNLSIYIKRKFNKKNILLAIAIIILIINVTLMWSEINQKSSILALREYVDENIPDNAIVVLDPRIYRGNYAYVFNDKHYLEANHFQTLMNDLDQFQGQKKSVPLYYIECGKQTTCSWSTEDYQRISEFGEQLTNYFKQNSQFLIEVTGTEKIAGRKHHFPIYLGTIEVPESIYSTIDQTHQFWFYPVGWKNPKQAVDNYQAKGFGKLINGVGFLILWVDVIIALLSIMIVGYFALKK